MFRKILPYLGCLIFAVLGALAISYVIRLITGPGHLGFIITIIVILALIYIIKNILGKKYEKILDPISTLLCKYDFDETIDALESLKEADHEVSKEIVNEIVFNKSINFITLDDAISLDNLINKEKTLQTVDMEFFCEQVLYIFLPQVVLLRMMIPFLRGKNFINDYIISPSSPVAGLKKLTGDFGVPEKFDLIFSHNQDMGEVQEHAKKLYDFAGPEMPKCLGPKYGEVSEELTNLLAQPRDMDAFNVKFDEMAAYFTNFSEGDCLPRWLFFSDSSAGLSNVEFVFEAMWVYAFQEPHDEKRFDQAVDLFERCFSQAYMAHPGFEVHGDLEGHRDSEGHGGSEGYGGFEDHEDLEGHGGSEDYGGFESREGSGGNVKIMSSLDGLLARIKSHDKRELSLDGTLAADLKNMTERFAAEKNLSALTSLASGLGWLNQTNLEKELLLMVATLA
ncbi:MAG: hypothetical protein LBF38_10790 [Deltaproteobacteria bacterium]|jgi:hypothetical protein|nr:hypothetical protein [Deltaproteobacteria bacterium]